MEIEFLSGAEVEVCSEEEGFDGAYFAATVERSQPKQHRYTVSYLSLLSDRKPDQNLRETVDARFLRPKPPPSSSDHQQAYRLHECVDAFHDEAWWSGVVVDAGDVSSEVVQQVQVCFPLHRELLSFPPSLLRPHLEWHSGRWVPPSLLELPPSIFPEGSKVEVAQLKDKDTTAWFPAVISKRIWKDNYLVRYSHEEAETATEIVHLKHLRPDLCCSSTFVFCVNDAVQAFYTGGWWPANVVSVSHSQPQDPLHPPKYTLHLPALNKEMQFDQIHVRPPFDWIDGKWLLAPESDTHPKSKFHNGMLVEVSSDEDGFKGAWFSATIIKPVGTKFCVEYRDLRTDDESALLQETVAPIHIRPVPPQTQCGPHPFRLLEEVDAYHNDGWWVGVVSKIAGKNRYVVYFRQWKEEMEFRQEDLRPHFEWVGSRWIRASLALEL